MGSLGLAAWAFLPRPIEGLRAGPRLRVALVDASASTAGSRAWLPWVRCELRELAVQAAAAGDELAVVAFADGLATGFAPGDPARFLAELEGRGGAPFDPRAGLLQGATRMAAALEGVEPWLLENARPPGELVLLGPASFTGRSPAPVLARLAAGGVALGTRQPPLPAESDLGLLELVLPPRVERGAPLVALARLVLRRGAAPAGTARMALALECDGAVREWAFELALPGTDGEFELPLDCGTAGPGASELRALVSLSGGPDLLPANDRARARTVATGTLTLGVAAHPESRAAAEEWLTRDGRSSEPGLQFVLLEPAELGAWLTELDALVSFDLAPRELPAPLLEPFVRHGGGWLALAGWRFLADWIPSAGGELPRLLPCEPAGSEAAPREVVLLVDGSGSMEGAPFESVRAAALELVSFALPADRVSLRFFTQALEPAHLLKEGSAGGAQTSAAARDAARELLLLRVPSGPTFLLRALRELGAAAGADETLLFLLSDGWERGADAEEAARRVAAELAAARVRLVVIAAGEANRALLAALAGGADEVRSGGSLGELRAVFRREVHASQLAEGELELQRAARAPGSLADEVASAASLPSPPAPLERHLRSRLRPGGEALWQDTAGEPVLALARAGLGRTAFFASLPGAGWASRHAHLADGELRGLLRWLARGPGRETPPRARLEDGFLRVSGLGPETPAELRAELLADDGARVCARLTLLPPGAPGSDVAGTRQAPVTEEEDSAPALLVRFTGDALQGQALVVERALAAELAWRERPVPAAWLRPESSARVERHARASRPLALLATGLGLGLLFVAALAAVRRSRSS